MGKAEVLGASEFLNACVHSLSTLPGRISDQVPGLTLITLRLYTITPFHVHVPSNTHPCDKSYVLLSQQHELTAAIRGIGEEQSIYVKN